MTDPPPDSGTLPTVDKALRLASAGYCVFPVALTRDRLTGRLNKKPVIPKELGGHGFEDATADPAQIRDWWRRYPEAVIGLALPLGTMVVDLDSYKAEYDAGHGLELPPSLMQETGSGGWQIFYRTDRREVAQRQGIRPAIDTRVSGKGYVVAWEPELIANTPIDAWALAPEWVYEANRRRKSEVPVDDSSIPAGKRHDYYLMRGGDYAKAGMAPDIIEAALLAESRRRSPDHDEDDLRAIAASAASWPPPATTRVSEGHAGPIAAPGDPVAVARELLAQQYSEDHVLTLRHWRGGWWQWRRCHWVEREERAIRRDAYAFTEDAVFLDSGRLRPWQPTRVKIGNLLEALAAVAHLDESVDQPGWIEPVSGPDVVAMANGLLDLDRRVLLPHSPSYFNGVSVPFPYDPAVPVPARWMTFLHELWPNDPESLAMLQEFFGYVISGRLDLHKILLIVGPTRGGKGTIARILGKLIGRANLAGPTLSSLSLDFGLAPLLGKALAVISDARLDASRDTSAVVERLLAISGEDTITVNRKYREQWTGKLPTRFLLISNELPRLGDASGTIANRFVVLLVRESWLGREDLGLEPALTTELSGILNWSLAGLDRLAAQGRFTRPSSTDEAILALQDLASPVAAFVRERCLTGPTHAVAINQLFVAWREWAELNGNRAGNAQTFGRNVRAVVPSLRVVRPRDGEGRERSYQGVALADQVPPSLRLAADHRGPNRDNGHPVATGPHWSAVAPVVGPAETLAPLAD